MARKLALAGLAVLFAAGCGSDAGEPELPPAAAQATAAPDSAVPDTSATASAADSAAQRGDDRLLRETFSYTGGARDPFVSLLETAHTGPELVDLTLVAVYVDLADSRNSVAVLRDRVSSRRYSLRPGDQIGRLQVARIGRKDVVFTLDDFGVQRQETLSLRKVEEESQ